MQRRGFSYAHVTKMGVDDLQLGDVAIHEATENTRKASDALRRARTWWLTKA
jgi:hypothetical protein